MGDDGLTALKEFKLVVPTEENGFNVFEQELENESSVFFHMTEGVNKDAILSSGFKSAKELGVGDLESVSYARNSFSCFANLGTNFSSEYIIFAVRFDSKNLITKVKHNCSDILVYDGNNQPEIIGFVRLPPNFNIR